MSGGRRALCGAHVEAVACGARHTAAVSFDGELYTFGSGKQGQLGHGILEDELYPMAVKEFTDATRSKRALNKVTHTLFSFSRRLIIY